MRDVVAVADVGELDAVEIAEALFEGHEVGEGLAGVFAIAERIDDGDAGVFSNGGDRGVGEGAQDNDLDAAFEVQGYVAQALSCAEARLRLIDEDCVAAERVHARLESE